jgi:hypothetical protein
VREAYDSDSDKEYGFEEERKDPEDEEYVKTEFQIMDDQK